jgi:hypothetical protein
VGVGGGLVGVGVGVGVATGVAVGETIGVGIALGAGVEAGVNDFRLHWHRNKTAAPIKIAVRYARAPNRASSVTDPLKAPRGV